MGNWNIAIKTGLKLFATKSPEAFKQHILEAAVNISIICESTNYEIVLTNTFFSDAPFTVHGTTGLLVVFQYKAGLSEYDNYIIRIRRSWGRFIIKWGSLCWQEGIFISGRPPVSCKCIFGWTCLLPLSRKQISNVFITLHVSPRSNIYWEKHKVFFLYVNSGHKPTFQLYLKKYVRDADRIITSLR